MTPSTSHKSGFDWKVWASQPRVQIIFLVTVCVFAVYGIIYFDMVSRAKQAYMKGETYLAWHDDPAAKKKFFQQKLETDKSELEESLKKGNLSEEDYAAQVEALEFDYAFRLEESSLKYAYQWFVDAYELFSPPNSKWARMARQKAPEVLEQWKEELRSQNIPFEDYMFE